MSGNDTHVRYHSWCWFFLATAMVPAAGLAAESRPNVVVILADDQGWGDLSVNGNTNLSTPHDRFAGPGRRAARAVLRLPGLFAHAGRVPHRTLPSARRRARRLDRRRAARTSTRRPSPTPSRPPATPRAPSASGTTARSIPIIPTPAASTSITASAPATGAAISTRRWSTTASWCRARDSSLMTSPTTRWSSSSRTKSRPFFCYVPFNTPHSPMQVPDRFWQQVRERRPEAARAATRRRRMSRITRAALAMCENIDWNVGRILDRLDELKLADRTRSCSTSATTARTVGAGTAA